MKDLDRQVAILNAMGQESRLLILQALAKKQRCACELPEIIGRTQSNTSMQLSKLHDLEIIDFEREGKKIFIFKR